MNYKEHKTSPIFSSAPSKSRMTFETTLPKGFAAAIHEVKN